MEMQQKKESRQHRLDTQTLFIYSVSQSFIEKLQNTPSSERTNEASFFLFLSSVLLYINRLFSPLCWESWWWWRWWWWRRWCWMMFFCCFWFFVACHLLFKFRCVDKCLVDCLEWLREELHPAIKPAITDILQDVYIFVGHKQTYGRAHHHQTTPFNVEQLGRRIGRMKVRILRRRLKAANKRNANPPTKF